MFEGYVGIQMWDGQLTNDVVFALLFLLFFCFAFLFHLHYKLFDKMLYDVVHLKERQNLSPVSSGGEWLFRHFMTGQALLLCGVSLFSIVRTEGYLSRFSPAATLATLALSVVGLVFYYWSRRFLYYLLGTVFADPDGYRSWRTGYNALIGLWGVALYLPTLWLAFVGGSPRVPIILFVLFYILSRFVNIYRVIRIFYKKNNRLFYLSLYLCAIEILPLFFIYKAVVYWYNFFGSSFLWH